MGRPSTYDSKKPYFELADKYLATCGREQTKLPKLTEFCREHIGANEDTVNDWLKDEAKDNQELIGAIKRVKEAQAEELQDDGLFGGKETNVAMAIFLLKANHGMIETGRTELVGKDGQPLTINVKLDMAGDYIPQVGGIITASTTGSTQSSEVQDIDLAQTSKKDNNSDNGATPTGAL